MKLFSDCSGECCVCACAGGCLAGHGDDDFYPATKEQVIDRLDKAQYKDYKDYMIGYLAGLCFIMTLPGMVQKIGQDYQRLRMKRRRVQK